MNRLSHNFPPMVTARRYGTINNEILHMTAGSRYQCNDAGNKKRPVKERFCRLHILHHMAVVNICGSGRNDMKKLCKANDRMQMNTPSRITEMMIATQPLPVPKS